MPDVSLVSGRAERDGWRAKTVLDTDKMRDIGAIYTVGG